MNINLGDLPTWLASVGTIGALGTALYQIDTERKRRITQEEHDRDEHHKTQARLIAAWVGTPPSTADAPGNTGQFPIHLINASQEPVYTPIASIVYIQGTGHRTTEELLKQRHPETPAADIHPLPITTLSILPPGQWRTWIPRRTWGMVLSGRPGAELAFTDRAGAHWIRRAHGQLEELPARPFDYFHLYGPHDLTSPEPDD